MRSAMLSCAFASAILSPTAFLSQNAVAESSEAGKTQTVEAPPGPAGKTGTVISGEQKLSAGAEADGHGQMSVLAAAAKAEKGKEAPIPAVDEETLSLYPTSAQCGECHKQIYEEWRSSQHAYASISPMFHAFEQKFQELTKGTVGTFCVRCHQQVGTQLGENRETPLWAMSQISREGVSCITCHRVKEQYGKVNGERRVEPGKIFEPVYGSGEKSVIKDIIANKETYSVKTSKDGRGTDIHNGMMTNPQLPSRSSASAATRLPSTWASSSRSCGISIATARQTTPASPARTATWARSPESPRAIRPHPPP